MLLVGVISILCTQEKRKKFVSQILFVHPNLCLVKRVKNKHKKKPRENFGER